MQQLMNCNTTAGSTPVTFSAIKHYINSTIQEYPPPQHARTASVYSHATLHTDISLSRRDQVLLAQLRSGHCHKLAAYVKRHRSNCRSVLLKMQLGISHTRTLVTGVSGHSKQMTPSPRRSRPTSVYPDHRSARGDPVCAGNSPVTRGRRTKQQQ